MLNLYVIRNPFLDDHPALENSYPDPVTSDVSIPDPVTNSDPVVSETANETAAVPTKKTNIKNRKRTLKRVQNKSEHYKTKWQYSKFQLTAVRQKHLIEIKFKKLELKKLEENNLN